MKKLIFVLSFMFLFTLSACQDTITCNTNQELIDGVCIAIETEDTSVIFNITEGFIFSQYEDEAIIDFSSLEITDYLGKDITLYVNVLGEYDITTPGLYDITLSVTDDYGTKGELDVQLRILEITCQMDPDQEKCYIHVDTIELHSNSVDITSVHIDGFVKLNYIISPSDAMNQNVTFSSSDEDIATVSEYGYVFGHTPGEVTITITTEDGNKTVSQTLTVLEKTCEEDPYQDKCAEEILGDTSRIVTLGESNVSGTNYKEVYLNDRIYYQIYVRTFADSDGNYKGDFNGITANLDYLKSLGVGGIWLMPINESRSDHGYEIDDYYDVDTEYGTMSDFETLLSAAEALDIDIIMDLVVNHMGARNPIFQDVLRNGTNSEYYNWFNWLDSDDPRASYKGSWGQTIWYNPASQRNDNGYWLTNYTFTPHSSLNNKVYCAYFSDWMPDLNLANPEVITYLKDVAAFWLNKGVDGFRMDATSHFFGHNEYFEIDNHQANLDFLTDYFSYMESVDPSVYVVVEAWESYTTYSEYHSTGVDAFNFSANYIIKDKLNSRLSNDIGSELNNIYNTMANYDIDFRDAPFLSNHDAIGRIAGATNSFEDSRQAAEILLTLPGNPYIYYGDELGMLGGRTNMIWGDYYPGLSIKYEDKDIPTVTEQLLDDDSLLHTYKELGELRTDSLALQYGDFIPYESGYLEGYYRVFENGDDKELVVVLFNFTNVFYISIPEEFTSYEIMYHTNDTNLGGISPNSTVILKLPYELLDDLT